MPRYRSTVRTRFPAPTHCEKSLRALFAFQRRLALSYWQPPLPPLLPPPAVGRAASASPSLLFTVLPSSVAPACTCGWGGSAHRMASCHHATPALTAAALPGATIRARLAPTAQPEQLEWQAACPDGEIGRHPGLKIPCRESGVPVRSRLGAPPHDEFQQKFTRRIALWGSRSIQGQRQQMQRSAKTTLGIHCPMCRHRHTSGLSWAQTAALERTPAQSLAAFQCQSCESSTIGGDRPRAAARAS